MLVPCPDTREMSPACLPAADDGLTAYCTCCHAAVIGPEGGSNCRYSACLTNRAVCYPGRRPVSTVINFEHPMSALTIRTLPRNLRRPILITAFSGWNDAAESATTAARYLASTYQAEKFAEIDPEEFYHFGLTRPTVRFKPDAPTGARDRVAGHRVLGGAVGRPPARPGDRRGLRAAPQVADLLCHRAGAGPAVRDHPGPHPRRAAGRGPAYPAGADRRQRLRSRAGRAAGRPAEQVRGPDGDRGRARHRRPRRGRSPRRACGPTSRTTSPGSRTPRPRGRSCIAC